MRIVPKSSKWFNFLFEFDYNEEILEFCRALKRKYGWDEFNFVKENDKKGWGFNKKIIFDEIISKYPETEVKIDTTLLFNGKINPISKEELPLSSDIDVKIKVPLYDFQKKGVDFIIKSGGKCMLADEMGLGKTVQSIAYANLNNFKTLVICPASLKLMWQNEIKKFTNKKSYIVYANKIKEAIKKSKKYNFIIINYEIIGKAIKGGLDFRMFDLAILDESFAIKNPNSLRSINTNLLSFISHKVLLTGTPILNRPAELWSQLHFIEPTMFPNRWKFYFSYCDPVKNHFGWDFSGASHLEDLRERIKGTVLRRTKKEVLKELPPKIESMIKIELSPSNWKKYLKIYSNFEQIINSGQQGVALARLTYLKQFLSLAKLENITEIINNILETGKKVIVFSQYLQPLSILKKTFSDNAVVFWGEMNTKEKQEAVFKFQNDKNVKIFLGSIKASGLGITLTAANICIFLDLDWTPSLHAQCSDRCHRIGTKIPVNIYYLIANKTIEENIYALLQKKMSVISELLQEEDILKIKNQSIFPEFLKQLKEKTKKTKN